MQLSGGRSGAQQELLLRHGSRHRKQPVRQIHFSPETEEVRSQKFASATRRTAIRQAKDIRFSRLF